MWKLNDITTIECLAHSKFSKIIAISIHWHGIIETGNAEFIHQSNKLYWSYNKPEAGQSAWDLKASVLPWECSIFAGETEVWSRDMKVLCKHQWQKS